MRVAGQVALVGLGLMGGSLARRLAEMGATVSGWDADAGTRAEAARVTGLRVPDRLEGVLEGAAGVVLATPLGALPELLGAVGERASGAWVTDVGSLQVPPLTWAREAGIDDRYVTSHPMTGRESSGFPASTEELYRGARIWLSTGLDASDGVGETVAAFWRGIGSRPMRIDADTHDLRMARVSHLPQVVSTHLAASLAELGVEVHELGPGGRDTTRLAASEPRMWRDILACGLASGGASLPKALPEALRAVARGLDEEARRLEAGDVEAFAALLARTRAWRGG